MSEHIITGVAPGWIFAGTVTERTAEKIVLHPAVWLEGDYKAPWPEVAAKGGRKKIGTINAIPEPFTIRVTAQLWECACDPGLVGAPALNALEGAK